MIVKNGAQKNQIAKAKVKDKQNIQQMIMIKFNNSENKSQLKCNYRASSSDGILVGGPLQVKMEAVSLRRTDIMVNEKKFIAALV